MMMTTSPVAALAPSNRARINPSLFLNRINFTFIMMLMIGIKNHSDCIKNLKRSILMMCELTPNYTCAVILVDINDKGKLFDF